MRTFTLSILIGAVVAVGCSQQETPPPSPTKTEVPSAQLPTVAPPAASSTSATESQAAVAPPPPPGADTAAVQAAAQAAASSESEPLGGKGRPLTEEEKSLLNYGIYMFKEEKGRYPKDLNEAVAARYIRRLPQLPAGESLKYDPQSGQVTIVKGK